MRRRLHQLATVVAGVMVGNKIIFDHDWRTVSWLIIFMLCAGVLFFPERVMNEQEKK